MRPFAAANPEFMTKFVRLIDEANTAYKQEKGKLTADSPEAFEAQRREVHKEVAQMAGMDWLEYCQLHGLAV